MLIVVIVMQPVTFTAVGVAQVSHTITHYILIVILQVLAAIVILAWVYTIMAGYHVSLKFIPTPSPS